MTDQAFRERFQYDPDKDLIGSGGFGSVYRAYDYTEKRYVALKISQVKDIYGKFTLLNEVELSKKIDDHTNVARYEFGFRLKHPFPVDYAIMAYYEEGNLDMLLRKRFGQLTEKEYYEIVEGLLKGIGHLHNENIIHRDLKLANILMLRTRQGQWRPKIADFGLSRQIEDTDASIANSAIGITIAYAAPEQIEGSPIRKNVDLWAIGVIIYRLLTGEMPFAAAQNADPTNANLEMSRKITQVELPERLNRVPEPYQTIIKRCFVKDSKERPQSAAELLDILKPFKPDSNSWKDTTTQSSTVRHKPPPPPSPSFDEPIAGTEIVPPSVYQPISAPKIEEFVEEHTQLEMPSASSSFGASSASVNEGETLIEPYSASQHIVDDNRTLIEPHSTPKHVVDDGRTLIEPHSAPKHDVDENKTLIDPLPVSQKQETIKKPISKKTKTAIGAGLLTLLLSFGICKMKSSDKTGTNPETAITTETPIPVSNPSTEVPTGTTLPANSGTGSPGQTVPSTTINAGQAVKPGSAAIGITPPPPSSGSIVTVPPKPVFDTQKFENLLKDADGALEAEDYPMAEKKISEAKNMSPNDARIAKYEARLKKSKN